MQTQVTTFLRSLTQIARPVLVLAGAAAIVVCVDWIPASIGSPHPIVAPAAPTSGSAQRGMLARTAACTACDVVGSTRKMRMSNVASGIRRCAHHANPAAVTTGVSQGVDNADLLILLDWHMIASNGYGFSLDRASCSAQAGPAAPFPIEASEAYEILARFRDESGGASADAGVPARGQGDPAAGFRQVTE